MLTQDIFSYANMTEGVDYREIVGKGQVNIGATV